MLESLRLLRLETVDEVFLSGEAFFSEVLSSSDPSLMLCVRRLPALADIRPSAARMLFLLRMS